MVAIIPIRSGSKGIPNKNIKDLNGKPLIWWVLNSLSNSKVDKIIVATDAPYLDLLNSFNFPKLDIYLRDLENSKDESSTEDVLVETINNLNLKGDIMLVQATSPLTTTEDFNRGIKKYSNYDSVLSVVKQKRFIWGSQGNSLNYDYNKRPRRQEFDGYYVENGAFYINTSQNILRHNNRLSGKIGLSEMSELTYYEIDSEEDWEVISSLLKNKKCK
jgi:N-acylneuraminate cytidylyltransferase|tara:strand:+ start:843 stop:1493 length:651 start_codon:yes stop_codon:yes gene_type:complete